MPGACISSPSKADRSQAYREDVKPVASRTINLQAEAAVDRPAPLPTEQQAVANQSAAQPTTTETTSTPKSDVKSFPLNLASSTSEADAKQDAALSADPQQQQQQQQQQHSQEVSPPVHGRTTSTSSTGRPAAAAHHRRASSSHKRTPSGHRLPSGPEPAAVDVEYLPSEQLEPLQDPEPAVEKVLTQLAGNDWYASSRELNTARQLLVHHQTLMAPQMNTIVPLLLKLVKNPRSALCKTAIMTAADAFTCYKDAVVPLLAYPAPETGLLSTLLLKASSNDKKFVVEEARAAMNTLAASTNSKLLLEALRPFVQHRSPKVRGQVAITMYEAARTAQDGELEKYGLEKLLKVAARYVTDNTSEAREAARQLLGCLKSSYIANGGEDWESFVKTNLDATEGMIVAKIQC